MGAGGGLLLAPFNHINSRAISGLRAHELNTHTHTPMEQLRMPDGSRHQHEFPPGAILADLRAFARTLMPEAAQFSISVVCASGCFWPSAALFRSRVRGRFVCGARVRVRVFSTERDFPKFLSFPSPTPRPTYLGIFISGKQIVFFWYSFSSPRPTA